METEGRTSSCFIFSDLWPSHPSGYHSPLICLHKLMQSTAELLKKHMLLLHCGTPAVSLSLYSWGNNYTHSGKHRNTDIKVLIHTFLWHTGIPGIVSFLRCLIANSVATLSPPQDAEGPVQPPEGATPHWRAIKISDCRGEREAL